METNESVMRSNLFLDRVGEVVLTLDSDGLSWKPVDSQEKFPSARETGIRFSDVYAIELIDWGSVHELIPNARALFLGRSYEAYRFVVHGFQRSKVHNSQWLLVTYTFGHKELHTCQTWVKQINSYLNMAVGRPQSLLVFVHPLSGKGNGCKTWETVAPIFARAKVKTKVTVTQRAGHAFDVVTSITNRELRSYDGVIAVGGDGFFSEILNGLLLSRHKAPQPPTPKEFSLSVENQDRYQPCRVSHGSNGRTDPHDLDCNSSKTSLNREDDPLLSNPESIMLGFSEKEAGLRNTDQDPLLSFPNEWFRLGIIPSGSTDAIVISTTGTRDPVTSALHIVLGKKVCLDIAQIVRWKTSGTSINPPSVRYAASFAGYGFYGDVIKESEKYRWMGPRRYDYAGTKVFLKHRSYEADIAFLEAKPSNSIMRTDSLSSGAQSDQLLQQRAQDVICRVNCIVCKKAMDSRHANADNTGSITHAENLRWFWSKGRFISVGAAIISCRNEKSPDGLVANAHLADGFMHLILIKECPLPLYLWHLTQLTRKGSNPLDFEFVEHHKACAFTFASSGDESVWNLDGELFEASHLSAQSFQGLINLFAAGPEI